jgi:methylphosphotriester-DNA--protein-cysteine methyltransferase
MSQQKAIIPDTVAEVNDSVERESWDCYHFPDGCDAIPANRPTMVVSVQKARRHGYEPCKKCTGAPNDARNRREDVISELQKLQERGSPDRGTDGATPETIAGRLDIHTDTVITHLRADDRVEQVWAIGDKGARKAYRIVSEQQPSATERAHETSKTA